MKCKVLISLGGVASTRAGAFAGEALRSCGALQTNCLVGAPGKWRAGARRPWGMLGLGSGGRVGCRMHMDMSLQ